jgi:hypothetical protein
MEVENSVSEIEELEQKVPEKQNGTQLPEEVNSLKIELIWF